MKGTGLVVLFCFIDIMHVQSLVISSQLSRNHSIVINPLIVEGYPVSIRRYPYLVNLVFDMGNATDTCDGSILSTNYVLTAGHCFMSHPIMIYINLGSTMLEEGTHINTTLYKIHPQFNYNVSDFSDYDIGIVMMRTAMTLDGKNSKPVLLAKEGTVLVQGATVTVIGWGILNVNGTENSPTLQAVKLKIVNQEECKKIYTAPDGRTLITPHMFCCGDDQGGKDSCYGDSGGPAIDSSGIQVGIVSSGKGCSLAKFPGTYTNIASVRSWVRSVAGV